MAALPVGVVGEQVEGADLPQPVVVLGSLDQGEVVLLEVGRHEALERSLAEGPVSLHGRGHEAPAERLGEMVGRDLPPEEPRWKVPERPLAALRLVHAERARVLEYQLHQKGRVAAPRHAALHRDAAAGEQIECRRSRRHRAHLTTCPLLRGQTCPSGSLGWLHMGQRGRPARTSARARSTKAVAWTRVMRKRATAGSPST